MRLKQILKKVLTAAELNFVPTSFDVIGRIIIFSDFPAQLKKKERPIGNEILKNFKHIDSVFKKTRKFSGLYRTQKLTLLAGKPKKETEYKENNVTALLDVEKVYFSPRLSTERKRVMQQVRPDEAILVMFSGSGIYPLVIGKNTSAKTVYGVEMNKIAHKYALHNVKRNKLEHKIKLYCGDARRVLPKLRKKFDRIVMPLPKDSESFLDLAVKKIKKRGTIHIYKFSSKRDLELLKRSLRKECRCKILKAAKCGQYSPRVFRWCLDLRMY